MHSYHIFYFPFKWEVKGRENMLFAEQTNLDNIRWNSLSNWDENPEVTDEKEQQELYNEQNYYYEFVHPVLYDTGQENSILKHFERREPQKHDVSYIISKRGGKTYTLKVDAINLNLYETGVGMLSFFLKNERDDQKEPEDILTINQYGRRIFPPFYADLEYRGEIAEYIAIEGLNGSPDLFREDFKSWIKNSKLDKKPWSPACFVTNLILDLYDGFKITPVIDDRMFVNCWYGNNKLSEEFKECNKESLDVYLKKNDFWYKYIYVDVSFETCQNDEMKISFLNEQTYKRWQKSNMLYGISRYSFVLLSTDSEFHKNVFAMHMRTVYSRMIELILIQRASILRFSDEVTRVSQLSKDNRETKAVVDHIGSLYKEYICFINQVHFKEVTAQDQGLELYSLISGTLKINEYVDSLDKEIEELHNYVMMLEERTQTKRAGLLNIIAMVFLPATLLTGIFNVDICKAKNVLFWQLTIIILVLAAVISYIMWYCIIKRKKK